MVNRNHNNSQSFEDMDDSIRFNDQSKAIFLQHESSSGGGGSRRAAGVAIAQPQTSCFGRCALSSIIATLITCTGTGVFCGCLYRALSITVDMFTTAYKLELESEWIKITQAIIIIISAVMGGLSLILLTIGCLATGATRAKIFTGLKSRIGGLISTGFFTLIVYLLFIFWFIVSACLVVPIIVYYMIIKNCEFKNPTVVQVSENPQDQCLSLSTFGVKLKLGANAVCTSDLIAFCNQTSQAGPLYVASFISSSLIVIGLVHFLCCLVANYAHIKDGVKLKEFEDAIKEEMELRNDYSMRKSRDL